MRSENFPLENFQLKCLQASNPIPQFQKRNKKSTWSNTMKIKNAVQIFKEYHKSILKEATIKSYGHVLIYLDALFVERNIDSIKQDDIFQFMELITENQAHGTKHLRFVQLKAFFNFCRNN